MLLCRNLYWQNEHELDRVSGIPPSLPITGNKISLPALSAAHTSAAAYTELLIRTILKIEKSYLDFSKPSFPMILEVVKCIQMSTGYLHDYFDLSTLTLEMMNTPFSRQLFISQLCNIIAATNQTYLCAINPKYVITDQSIAGTHLLLQELCRAAASGISIQDAKQLIPEMSKR
jgi:hypothetical protein